MRLDPGAVYESIGGRLFLAVSRSRAVSPKDGDWVVSNRSHLLRIIDINTGALCREWGVTMAELDAMSVRFFPRSTPKEASPSYRGAQRRRALHDTGPPVYKLGTVG